MIDIGMTFEEARDEAYQEGYNFGNADSPRPYLTNPYLDDDLRAAWDLGHKDGCGDYEREPILR